MGPNDWVKLTVVHGELVAESLRGLLEAQGISVYLNQEGAGRAYGLSVGPLGATLLLVREADLPTAKEILADYQQGKFENYSFTDHDEENNSDDQI